jgi:2'-5' RNA ligase
MRLFAAIDLDDPARRAMAEVQSALRRALDDDLRWVLPDQLHLTLAFLSDVAPTRLGDVMTLVAAPVRQTPFDVVFAGLGMFPTHGAPRALWIGVQEGARNLLDLEAEIVRRLRDAGFDIGSGPFRPHLTLARFRRSRSRRRGDLRNQATPGGPIRQRIDHVTLYESELSSGPPRYRQLVRANLTSV